MNPERLILIVTGASLAAEAADRPIAYHLRTHLQTWLDAHDRPFSALVCSDLWYLNNDQLRTRPTISIGGPAVNALAAYLADKLPSIFAIDDHLIIQADPEFLDMVASCWGRDGRATAAAVETFTTRYLEAFMLAAAPA